MRAGFGLTGIATKRAPNRMRGVAIVIEDEVWVAVAGEPALDLFFILSEGGPDGTFRGFTVGPGRSGRDFAFVAESIAELVVCTTDVLAQSVAAGRFVLGEVPGFGASEPGISLRVSRGWVDSNIAGSRNVASERECQKEERN